MPLAAGTRLGHYEIVSAIGAGGMGQVYRARDTKLNRDVALKVLPEAFSADPDRLTRFKREAQVLASLNHPNIAHIHGFEDAGPTSALVMELVDGATLAEMIQTSRGLPLDEALPIARQIAEALEAAHERGIVHRDLKPANIKLTPEGIVKVLDFGLAKTTDPSLAGHESAASSPTLTSPLTMTQMGVVLGTAAYMAPEQTRGRLVDRRADIWAFGCVLSEMLCGRRPFGGTELTDILAAIVRDEPDFTALPLSTPAAVRTLIERCLEKDPKERLRDIGEARIALSRTVASAPAALPARFRFWVPIGWAAGGALVGAALMLSLRPRPPERQPAILSLRQLTELPGAEINPDISPDGRQVLYAGGAPGNRDLYLLRVGGGRAINLTSGSPAEDLQGTFSPDGERIAFRSERDGGGLFVMGATGESIRRITSAGFDPRWSPDGKRLVYASEAVDDPYSRVIRSELWTADVESGAATRVWTGDAVQPAWSPHGTRIAFWANTAGQRDISTLAAAGGAPVAVTADGATDWAPEWSPDGRWLYFISDRGGSPNLWRIAIDESSGRTSGAPEPVTNGVRAIASARFSRNGTRMVIGATDRVFELSLSTFDAAKPEVAAAPTTIRSASLGWCAPSRDAAWLACTSRNGQEDIVLLRADGSESRRLTDDAFKDRIAAWSPDNRTVAFMSVRSGRWQLWAIGADGSGLRQLTDLKADISWGAWSPDGKRLAMGSPSVQPYGLWLLDPSSTATHATARFFPTDDRIGVDTWSSDGTLLAGGETGSSGNPTALTIWDIAAGKLRHRIELPLVRSSSLDAVFVPGSHDLLATTGDGLALVNADSGRWRVIRKIPPPFESRVSGDGRTLLLERASVAEDLWLMEFRQ
ncbi:MAG TPA: protein kinase [Gemmatimonadales bacterium]|nr:protein kinase [Gemmatimonadales bacterium]